MIKIGKLFLNVEQLFFYISYRLVYPGKWIWNLYLKGFFRRMGYYGNKHYKSWHVYADRCYSCYSEIFFAP